jgi:MFS family permease
LWTSAYVHLDDQHLFSNLQGYGTAIAPLYVLYWYWGRRRDLRRAILVMLLVFPFLVSGASYLVFGFVFHATETAATRGFSGIVAALAGFLFGSLVAFLAERYGRFRGISAGLLMLLVALGALLFSVSAVVAWWEMGVIALGIVLEASILVPREVLTRPSELRRVVAENWEAFGVVVYGF